MNCPHCHAENQNGLFCTKCGKPLDESVSDKTRIMPPVEAEAPNTEDMTADTASVTAATSGAPAEENSNSTEIALEEDDAFACDCITGDEEDDFPSKEAVAPIDDVTPVEDDAFACDCITGDEEDDFPSKEAAAPIDDATSVEDDALACDCITGDEEDDFPSKETTEPADDTATEAHTDQKTESDSALTEKDDAKTAKRKKIMTAAALVCGIALAAFAGLYIFNTYFSNHQPMDTTHKVKNADTIAPDTSLAEDAIVGHWRHYNDGSVIEKIGNKRYRWTIDDDVYQLVFKDNQYIYEDEQGSTYAFVLLNADRLQLAASEDADGGLIKEPVFESGYLAGRVGPDGTMAKSLSVNPEAFNIVGRSYAELAGTYGPGALSVVGDDQYIIFRADGGNFAVQFTGQTVPLKKESGEGYKVVKLTGAVPVYPNTNNPNTTEPNTGNNNNNNNNNVTNPNGGSTTDNNENKEYKVEIPDMPTFPSNSAIATGVVWADLGFVINNAPDTMTVEDLSAVLGIALEVGSAPGNASGFKFYGSEEGYFAGTFGLNDHSYHISGYGKTALSPNKTLLFIQQIS